MLRDRQVLASGLTLVNPALTNGQSITQYN